MFGGEAGSISTETPLWIYDTEVLSTVKIRFRLFQSRNSALYFVLQISVWRKLAGSASTTGTVRRRNLREQKNGALGPRGRRGHSAHALKDCLLIYGGYKDFRGSTNELWAFHYGMTTSLKGTVHLTRLSTRPAPRCTATILTGKEVDRVLTVLSQFIWYLFIHKHTIYS